MKPDVYFRLNETEYQAITGALRYWLSILEPSDARFGTGAPNDPFTATPQTPPTVRPEANRNAPASVPQNTMPPRDRWSHDREGKEIAQPNAEAYTVRIWHCEQAKGTNGPFLKVKWDQRRAYCHDPKLFPWILEAAKARTPIVLYLKQRDQGAQSYDHIIGVKA